MLSIFPQLFAFSLFAPLILRVAVGCIFVLASVPKLKRHSPEALKPFENTIIGPARAWLYTIGILELVGGLFLIIGLFTQPVAIVLLVIVFKTLFLKYKLPRLFPAPVAYYMLILAVLVSLLVTGAGVFAIDLPL